MTYLGNLADDPRFRTAVELFHSRFEQELATIPGAGPTSDRGVAIVAAAIRVIEGLIGQVQRDLMNDRSVLSRQLAEAKMSFETLERQLDLALRAVADAQRSRRPGFLRSAVLMIGGLLAGVASGAADGAANVVTSSFLDGDAPSSVQEFYLACFALDEALDRSGVFEARIDSPPQARSNTSDSATAEAEKDSNDELFFDRDPWLVPPPEVTDTDAWRHAGFTPDEALEWTTLGIDAADAFRWIAYRFTPTEAAMWIRAALENHGWTVEPSEATSWRDEVGLGPEEAMRWTLQGFDADSAGGWISEEFEPEDAVEWINEGFDSDEAATMRERGETVQTIRLQLWDDKGAN